MVKAIAAAIVPISRINRTIRRVAPVGISTLTLILVLGTVRFGSSEFDMGFHLMSSHF